MKAIWLPIVLQLVAFGVAIAETMVPSFGVLTVVCLGLLAWSFALISALPPAMMTAFLIVDAILIPLGLWILFKGLGRSPLSHRSDLGTGTGMENQEHALSAYIGKTGVVESMLRPSGKVRIGEETFEAMTSGDFLEKGISVNIIGLKGPALLVERIP